MAVLVDSDAVSVDTYEDLEYVRKIMLEDELFETYKS